MAKYQYTDQMREISGFGGSYEEGCRAMVIAGITWWDNHPDADPHYRGISNVFGICLDNNADAKRLDEAIANAKVTVDGKKFTVDEYGYTGAMHQAAVSHIFYIKKNGWDKYVEEMSKKEKE